MSALFFFSSDHPLEEIKNPHYKKFSVNEALAFGLELPDLVLNSKTIDRDKPNTILWSDLGMEKEIDPITRKVVDNGISDDETQREILLPEGEYECFLTGQNFKGEFAFTSENVSILDRKQEYR